MPLLNRKAYLTDPIPDNLDGNTKVPLLFYHRSPTRSESLSLTGIQILQVWFIEETDEATLGYDAFIKKVNLYRKEVWSCKFTGQGSLTYSEALREEAKAIAGLLKFPPELEGEVCKSVHHFVGSLDEALNNCYKTVREIYKREESAADEAGLSNVEERSSIISNDNSMQPGKPVRTIQKKSKMAKLPVSRTLLRTYIVKNFSPEGHDHGRKRAWVAQSPELVQKFALPEEMPINVREQLAACIRLPKKRQAPENTHEQAEKRAKKDVEAPDKPRETMPIIPSGPLIAPKSLDEVKEQYAEGTVKKSLVDILIATYPQGLSLQCIMEKGKELGIREFDENNRSTLASALTRDNNFVRLEKGIYSLHALFPEKLVYRKSNLPKLPGTVILTQAIPPPGLDGKAMLQGDVEVDGLSKVEHLFKRAKVSFARHTSNVLAARMALQKAKEQYEKAKDARGGNCFGKKKNEGQISSEALRRFEMSEEDRKYKGHPDDRKAMLEHRQWLQQKLRVLEKEKIEFIKMVHERIEQDTEQELSGFRAAENALKAAEKRLELAEQLSDSAEKALASAEKRLENEQIKAEKCVEREKRRLEEKEERERKKAEAAAAKKYPIEDLELLHAPYHRNGAASDVHPATWLNAEDGRRMANMLFISDFVSQFARSLGLSFVSSSDIFPKNWNDAEDLKCQVYHSLYLKLMGVILEDARSTDEATPLQKRWLCLLSDATWPEVLRRMVLTAAAESKEMPHKRPSEHASLSASMLGFNGADSLTHDQHLALLNYLCDVALNTQKLRSLLAQREEMAHDARRDIRGDIAEERKRLKDLIDEEKEDKRRKMDEEKLDDLASKQARIAPSFELPEDLVEFRGDHDDKKALLVFRQMQQAEKRRLEKEKAKWLGETLRAQRTQEARRKEEKNAEKAKAEAREKAEEALARAQDALDEKAEKYAVRRTPLGHDRHFRRYWWGLGAYRTAVLVEDAVGNWGMYASLAHLNAFLGSLDRRGYRELSLAQAIEKRYDAVEIAFKKSDRQREKDTSIEEFQQTVGKAVPIRQSSRPMKKPEFYNPSRQRGIANPKSQAQLSPYDRFFGPLDAAGIEHAMTTILRIQEAAVRGGVPAPEHSSWQAWLTELKGSATGNGNDAVSIVKSLQTYLLQLEETLYLVSEEPEEEATTEDEDDDSEDLDDSDPDGTKSPLPIVGSLDVLEFADEAFSPSKDLSTCLWSTLKERLMWKADLLQGLTACRLAYCASVLDLQATPLIASKRRTGFKKERALVERKHIPGSTPVEGNSEGKKKGQKT